MNVSDVLGTTMASLRDRGLGLVGIWLAFVVLAIVFVLVAMVVVGGSLFAAAGMGAAMGDGADQFAGGLGIGMIAMMVVFYILYFLIYMAQGLAMAYHASPLVEGNVGTSFGVGFRGAVTMLGVTILFAVAYFLAALVFGVVGALMATLGEAAVVLYALVLVPAGIYLMCRFCIIMAVVAVDGVRNPVTAIARSWNLTGGNVLAIFLSLLAFMIAGIVVFGGLFYAFFGSMQSYQEAALMGGEPNVGSLIGFFLAFAIAGLGFAAASAALFSAIHSRLSDTGAVSLEQTFG